MKSKWRIRRLKCAFCGVGIWLFAFFIFSTTLRESGDSLSRVRNEHELPADMKVSHRSSVASEYLHFEATKENSFLREEKIDGSTLKKYDNDAFLRTRSYIVNPLDHALLISPRENCKGKVVLLVMVLSQYSNTDRRNVIRKSWGGKYDGLDVRTYFIFGRQKTALWDEDLRLESEKYQDIIQYDFKDTYENLIYKSLSMLRWSNEHCKNADFVLKVDDDVLLMTPNLYSRLSSLKPEGVLLGYTNPKSMVLRGGKWKVPFDEFPFSKFPKYLSGMAYVMSQDVVETLLNAARRVPLIQVEDAYITGILANITNVHHIKDPYFLFARKYYLKAYKTACQRLPQKTITLHLEEPGNLSLADFMMMTYTELSTCKKKVVQSWVKPHALNESNPKL
ncbi:UDP-GalNAc:beta-1,3-N-acetylgalactosaminyltransferase 1 [Lingula anatina]|uniref:Hexosyltransferase n=1 Tax=Lingula anatina TaxID=7574 RepID=A0A1S3JWQ9_LINAN|nr:UDP-GalNAc:beta-1,3-N-acetylgalactosaminyltransferase 1 [Lingula anatina]|eukprot:XP_013414865.1 UDP-GalNAc:beta-1,3-N-acetylgalactosaminyltransferase 1 [Lingula anatina]